MAVELKQYTEASLAGQSIGYWSGEAYRVIVGRIRSELAVEQLTQPHWWTLNHVAAAPGRWSRTELTDKLGKFDDQDIDFEDVFDDLVQRGWLREESGTLILTPTGEAGLGRARDRSLRANEQTSPGQQY